MRRAAALWLLLFAVYAATIGMDASGGADYSGDEPHYLLIAESLVEDRSADLRDEFRTRAYEDLGVEDLQPLGSVTGVHVHEPLGVGFSLLIAPAYAIAGAKAVEVFLAAVAALALVLGYLLALRVVPDPWALGAMLAIGLSPPLLAYSTAVYPELPAAAALCGAALLVLRAEDRPRRRTAWAAFALIALLPWLGAKYLLAGGVVTWFGYRVLRRARRPVLAITSVEIVGFSVALWVGVNEGIYGGPTPYAAEAPGVSGTGAGAPLEYLERVWRFAALLVDRDYGLLRWAPFLALALLGVFLLLRAQRTGIARAIPGLRGRQSAALLCAGVAGAQLLVAVFLAPSASGDWFGPRHVIAALPVSVALAAIGLRRVPRLGAALGLLTVAASVWLYVDVRFGGGTLVSDLPDAPWGPLVAAFPQF